MDIFFADPSEIPLPQDEVRIRELRAELRPDQRLLYVFLEVDPFQKRPNADLIVSDDHDDEIARASIIESMARKMEVNIHFRGELKPGRYTLSAVLYYAQIDENENSVNSLEQDVVDTAVINFDIS